MTLERDYPFGRKLLLFGVYDIIDRLNGRIGYDERMGAVTSKLSVCGRTSTFAFSAKPTPEGSRLGVAILRPAEGLSIEGQERALHFLIDSVDRHLENILRGQDIPEALRRL